jgi:hypothetical protein
MENQKQERSSKRQHKFTSLDYSTRYDDKELIPGTNRQKLDFLSLKIDSEVMDACDDILKLERLNDRYDSDGLEAKKDGDMAYYMRYLRACERINNIINAWYLTLPMWRGK